MVVALGATDVDAEEGRADVGGEPVEVLDPLPQIFGGDFLALSVWSGSISSRKIRSQGRFSPTALTR